MNQNPINPVTSRWHDIYHANLLNTLFEVDSVTGDRELINHTFKLVDPRVRALNSKARNFNEHFGDLMFDWIISGGREIPSIMYEVNPNAKNYSTMFEREDGSLYNVAYGPRLIQQLPEITDLLRLTGGTTRRANIMILDSEDRHVGLALEHRQTKCEYPCTLGFNFRIRQDRLDMITSMRSNNYTTTVCQDIYVFTRIMEWLAQQLNVNMGTYYHYTQSGHVFKHDVVRARLILEEYMETLPNDNPIGRDEENIYLQWRDRYEQLPD